MSDFDEKINKILSSPEDMEKIMGMAKSLSGSLGASSESDTESSGGMDFGALTSMLGSVDPKVMRTLGRVFSEYSGKKSDKTAIISAIKPYIKEDRREKIEKAAEIAKLAHIAKLAFSEFSGGGGDV